MKPIKLKFRISSDNRPLCSSSEVDDFRLKSAVYRLPAAAWAVCKGIEISPCVRGAAVGRVVCRNLRRVRNCKKPPKKIIPACAFLVNIHIFFAGSVVYLAFVMELQVFAAGENNVIAAINTAVALRISFLGFIIIPSFDSVS